MGKITEKNLHNGAERPTTPLKAIKAMCYECCGYNRELARSCMAEQCPLWCFKDGKNPYRKPMSEEQKAKSAERMRNMWKNNEEVVGEEDDEEEDDEE